MPDEKPVPVKNDGRMGPLREEIRQLWEYRTLPERLRTIDCLSHGLTIRDIARKDRWRDCKEIRMYTLYVLGHPVRSLAEDYEWHHRTIYKKLKKAERMIRKRFPGVIK